MVPICNLKMKEKVVCGATLPSCLEVRQFLILANLPNADALKETITTIVNMMMTTKSECIQEMIVNSSKAEVSKLEVLKRHSALRCAGKGVGPRPSKPDQPASRQVRSRSSRSTAEASIKIVPYRSSAVSSRAATSSTEPPRFMP